MATFAAFDFALTQVYLLFAVALPIYRRGDKLRKHEAKPRDAAEGIGMDHSEFGTVPCTLKSHRSFNEASYVRSNGPYRPRRTQSLLQNHTVLRSSRTLLPFCNFRFGSNLPVAGQSSTPTVAKLKRQS